MLTMLFTIFNTIALPFFLYHILKRLTEIRDLLKERQEIQEEVVENSIQDIQETIVEE